MLWNIRGFIFEDRLSRGWHVTRSIDHMAKDLAYYFKPIPKCDFDLSKLPRSIPQATIKAVQKEADGVASSGRENSAASNGKRGVYMKISETNKAMIGECANNHGVAATIRHFKQTGQFRDLKESSVRGWWDAYSRTYKHLKQESRKRPGSPVKVEKLPEKRRGLDHSYSVKKWKEKCSALLQPAGNWVLLSVQKL